MSARDLKLVEDLRDYAGRVHSIGCWQAAAVMRKAANRLDQLQREKKDES